jgi:5-methylthioribose kinase
VALKVKVEHMFRRFASNTETMVHGDLHSGSIMSTASDSRIIDPEFAQYGPMGFDVGMLIANFLMSYFSQPAHRGDDLPDFQEWILQVIADTCKAFDAEFRRLWQTERTGMLYPKSLFEDQGQDSAPACDSLLAEIWQDAWAVCGIEMHRRCLSLAHNADFEDIEDEATRAPLEARNLLMGAELILRSDRLNGPAELCDLARAFNEKDVL